MMDSNQGSSSDRQRIDTLEAILLALVKSVDEIKAALPTLQGGMPGQTSAGPTVNADSNSAAPNPGNNPPEVRAPTAMDEAREARKEVQELRAMFHARENSQDLRIRQPNPAA